MKLCNNGWNWQEWAGIGRTCLEYAGIGLNSPEYAFMCPTFEWFYFPSLVCKYLNIYYLPE